MKYVRVSAGALLWAAGSTLAAPPEPGVHYHDEPGANPSMVRFAPFGESDLLARSFSVSGPSDELVDIVFIGDGYTEPELPQFVQDANQAADDIFSYEPFISYLPFFEFHFPEQASNESGVDNDPVQGIQKDTAFDMTFWCGGTERALCVNTSKARGFAAANVPGWDVVVALANTTKYGGVGYPSLNVATSAGRNGSTGDIVLHELGHALGNLADEYTYGGPFTYSGGEPAGVNVSTLNASEMAAQNRKWATWLDASLPGFDNPISTYEGANYSVEGIYRPTNNSMMRALGRPFNLVSAEALILAIHDASAMITTADPAPGEIGVGDSLSLTVVESALGPMGVRWLVNGSVVAEGDGLYSIDTATLGTVDGDQVTVEVVDESIWVRDEAARESVMTERLTWTVVGTACNVADIADPAGILDLSDVDRFILTFVLGASEADIAAPFGIFDLSDIDAFIESFLAGCP
ncbi:MAG: M64 family metallopeptidase [Planctomycetota bacterium]